MECGSTVSNVFGVFTHSCETRECLAVPLQAVTLFNFFSEVCLKIIFTFFNQQGETEYLHVNVKVAYSLYK